MRRTAAVALAALVAVPALPAAAWAHAALLRTVPLPSGTGNTPPKQLLLTYSEAVEPRFAIVSVTDVNANRVTSGSPQRSPTDADTLVVAIVAVAAGSGRRSLA